MKCPVCNSSSALALTKDGFDYFRCSSCEFLFHRAETRKETTSFYDNKYWSMERLEALRREREDCFDRALELLYLSTIPVRNILDFGCGLGITVTLLRESLGLNAVGVDPNRRIRAFGVFAQDESGGIATEVSAPDTSMPSTASRCLNTLKIRSEF